MRGHGWFMIRSFRRSRQLSMPQKSQTSANASIAEARRFGAAPASSAATDREAQRAFARFLTHGSPRRRRGRAALGRAVLATAADAAGTLRGAGSASTPRPAKASGTERRSRAVRITRPDVTTRGRKPLVRGTARRGRPLAPSGEREARGLPLTSRQRGEGRAGSAGSGAGLMSRSSLRPSGGVGVPAGCRWLQPGGRRAPQELRGPRCRGVGARQFL